MAVFKTPNQLIADAFARTQRENDEGIEPGLLIDWVREQIQALWALCVRVNPDEFTKTSPSFTIPTGNTHVIGTGSTAAVIDFLTVRGVDYDNGNGVFVPLKPYRFSRRGNASQVGYRVYGKTIDIQPARSASQYTYQLKYVYQPVFGDGNVPIDLPLGGDTYVTEGLAALIRGRFEEDPADHRLNQSMSVPVIQRFLADHAQGRPEQIPEAGDYLDDVVDDGGW